MSRGRGRYSVLFLCTHNSARSQIAEAILRSRAGDRFDVASAGTDPGEALHPMAVDLIREMGGDLDRHRPKPLDAVMSTEWDLVITVCDRAREICPRLPDRTVSAHWGIPDPGDVEGGDEERRAAFRYAQKLLARRIDLFLALGPEKIDRFILRDRLNRIHQEPDLTREG